MLEAEALRARNVQVQLDREWKAQVDAEEKRQMDKYNEKLRLDAERDQDRSDEWRTRQREGLIKAWEEYKAKDDEDTANKKAAREKMAKQMKQFVLLSEKKDNSDKIRKMAAQERFRNTLSQQIQEKRAVKERAEEDEEERRQYEIQFFKNKCEMFVKGKEIVEEADRWGSLPFPELGFHLHFSLRLKSRKQEEIRDLIAELTSHRKTMMEDQLERDQQIAEEKYLKLEKEKAEKLAMAQRKQEQFRQEQMQQLEERKNRAKEQVFAIGEAQEADIERMNRELRELKEKNKVRQILCDEYNMQMLERKKEREREEKKADMSIIERDEREDDEFHAYAVDLLEKMEKLDSKSAYPLYADLRRDPTTKMIEESKRERISSSRPQQSSAHRTGMIWLPDFEWNIEAFLNLPDFTFKWIFFSCLLYIVGYHVALFTFGLSVTDSSFARAKLRQKAKEKSKRNQQWKFYRPNHPKLMTTIAEAEDCWGETGILRRNTDRNCIRYKNSAARPLSIISFHSTLAHFFRHIVKNLREYS